MGKMIVDPKYGKNPFCMVLKTNLAEQQFRRSCFFGVSPRVWLSPKHRETSSKIQLKNAAGVPTVGKGYSVIRDQFSFVVSTPKQMSDVQVFELTYSPGDTSVDITLESCDVEEGGRKVITNKYLEMRSLGTPAEYIERIKLKGECHEIGELEFFYDSNPSRPLIHRLKYFRIRFRRDIRIFWVKNLVTNSL